MSAPGALHTTYNGHKEVTVVILIALVIIVVKLSGEEVDDFGSRHTRLILHTANGTHELLLEEVLGEIRKVIHPGDFLVISTAVDFLCGVGVVVMLETEKLGYPLLVRPPSLSPSLSFTW